MDTKEMPSPEVQEKERMSEIPVETVAGQTPDCSVQPTSEDAGQQIASQQATADALREEDLNRKEKALKDREAALKEDFDRREQALKDKETTLKEDFDRREQALKDREAALKEDFDRREKALKDRETTLKEDLDRREKALKDRETALKEDKDNFAKEQQSEGLELQNRLNALWEEGRNKLEKDLDDFRNRSLKKIEENENKEQEKLEAKLAEQERKFHEKQTRTADELDKRDAILRQREQEVTTKEQIQQDEREQINAMRAHLKDQEKALPELSRQKADALIAQKDKDIIDLKKFIEDQGQENRRLNENIQHFNALSQKLGNKEPEELLQELRDYECRIAQLKQDLAERPGKELQARYDELAASERAREEQYEKLRKENHELKEIGKIQADSEYELSRLRSENVHLSQMKDFLEAYNNKLEDELRRLQTQYGNEADRNERIQAIEYHCIDNKPGFVEVEENSEIKWLENIATKFNDFDFIFPRRILYAFHTSLKISEWSPITVLAGVSGTGKSELPRLYALFGGLNFMMVPVQPNWDSQESMLGFFNTIDNKFDAQPVLRFLAQSQKDPSDDPLGMRDAVNLVLLDEMNLAHIELYFAEFLSKLEARRGSRSAPFIDVKLGSGMQPYQLTLGRNVLWTGTMNQDETTKSLSDKVLDRSGVIYFPRPSELKRRGISKTLPKYPEELLKRKTWQGWTLYDSEFSDETIAPYKKFVEGINHALSKVGRALGHRVWQSVENYMANYPTVRELRQRGADNNELHGAMHIAFEDQLVQKVMPKLRGIETRGKARSECLDVIRNLLEENQYGIVNDFSKACEMGYGQFMWNSAEYLDSNGDNVGMPMDDINGAHHE